MADLPKGLGFTKMLKRMGHDERLRFFVRYVQLLAAGHKPNQKK